MALPKKLMAARLSNATLGTAIDDRIGELEAALADILGITIDSDVTASAFSMNNSGEVTKALVAQRAAGPVGWRFRDTTTDKEARVVINSTNLDIDENTGTEGAPVWTNRLRMALATGALTGTVATTSADGLCPAGDGDSTHYLNGNLVFSLPAAASGPSVKAIQAGSQSIGTGGTPPAGLQAITLDAESWDNDGMHSNVTNPGYITCVTPGLYYFLGEVNFAPNSSGYRMLKLIKDSATTFGVNTVLPAGASVLSDCIQVSGAIQLIAGNHVSLFAYQNSGVSLLASGSFLSAYKIG